MKFNPLLAGFAALSLAAAPASSQSAPDFRPEAFRSHVAFLADDLLEGREAGSRGYEIAARYVASRFEALGLQPANDGNWLQPVQFVRYAVAGTPTLSVGGQVFQHRRDMIVRASAETEALNIEAPLVFAGYGLDLPQHGHDDYRGLDVRGRIVVVLAGSPIGTPSDLAAHFNSEKARMAAARGAVGMLVVRTRGEAESMPWARVVQYGDRPGTSWIDPQGRPFNASGLRFSATVDAPVAAILFSGAPKSIDNILLEAARPGGRPRGFALPRRARFQRDGATLTRFDSPNVVALLPGSDPALANEAVLLMAHLDGLGVAEARPGDAADADRIRNGAMDNATGVATLIEVARQMSQDGHRPRRPILFAAVTAEEKGLLGAEYLAQNPVGPQRVVGVVNLDMPILTYDFSDVTAFGAEHSTLGPIVARAAARMNVRLSPDPLPQEGLFTRSDHYRFVQRGIPSVFLMTGFAGEGRDRFTGFLRTEYHSPKDDLALPFNWNAGARFAQLNYLIASEIANAPEAPLWYADSLFGDRLGRSARRAERPAVRPLPAEPAAGGARR